MTDRSLSVPKQEAPSNQGVSFWPLLWYNFAVAATAHVASYASGIYTLVLDNK